MVSGLGFGGNQYQANYFTHNSSRFCSKKLCLVTFFLQHRIAHRKLCNPFSDTTEASVWIFNPVLLTVHWAWLVTSDAANMQLMDYELFMVNVAQKHHKAVTWEKY